jgi:hypothetical protein
MPSTWRLIACREIVLTFPSSPTQAGMTPIRLELPFVANCPAEKVPHHRANRERRSERDHEIRSQHPLPALAKHRDAGRQSRSLPPHATAILETKINFRQLSILAA